MQFCDFLGLHQQLHLGVTIQPEFKSFFEDGVADMDLKDVSGVGQKGLEHDIGDGFVFFGVFYDG